MRAGPTPGHVAESPHPQRAAVCAGVREGMSIIADTVLVDPLCGYASDSLRPSVHHVPTWKVPVAGMTAYLFIGWRTTRGLTMS